jgi:hypothetical protein
LLFLVELDAIQKSIVQIPIFHVTTVQEGDRKQSARLDEIEGIGSVGLR